MTKTPDHKPHVLLTNDDGIQAEGLRILAETLAPHADLTIVAPRQEQSGKSHAITFLQDLSLETFERDGRPWGWSLDGTPTDCVKFAMCVLCKDKPFDMVISGINEGLNAGINILYSGTVGAAREAAVMGIPAIATSLYYHDLNYLPYATAARVTLAVFQRVRDHGLAPGVMLNVNVPPLAYEELKGWAITRMGTAFYADLFVKGSANGDTPKVYRNVGEGWMPTPHNGSDHCDDHALEQGKVSISPLTFDLTHYGSLDALAGWIEPLSNTSR